MHYLDNFLVFGKSRDEDAEHLHSIQSLCSELGVPFAEDKIVWPLQTLTYLGMEIDASQQIICLPTDTELQTNLLIWHNIKKCL